MHPLEIIEICEEFELVISELKEDGAKHACAIKVLNRMLTKIRVANILESKKAEGQ